MFEPHWRESKGANEVRCMMCENFKTEVWLYFSEPSKWIHAVCVECSLKLGS